MDHARAKRPFLELDLFKKNALGRRFYHSYGFVRVAEHVDEATQQPEIRLRRD